MEAYMEARALESFVGEQQLSAEDARVKDEAYARLRVFRDGCLELHERARVARKVLLLQDPMQDTPNTPIEQRTLQLQTLKSTFNNCVADQLDNRPEAMMSPETPMLQEVADDLNDVVRFIYERNGYENFHRKRVEDYLCVGTAVTQVMWDADMNGGNGDIALIRVPVEAFLYDPAEEDIQSARALFKVSWHPLSWYVEHYPDAGKYVQSDEHTSIAVGENENQEQSLSDEPKAMLVEYWYRLYDADKRRYTINCMYLAGGAVLGHQKDVYAHGMYPFIVDVYTPIEGLPVGEGLVMELAPMMRYVNRYAKYMDANIRASAKMRLLANRNAGIDIDTLVDWSQDVIQGDSIGEEAVRFLQSAPLNGMVMSQMLQMQTDIKQDSGQNQFTRGETAGGVTAASAIMSLQEAGGKQTRMRTLALNMGFKRITEQVLWLISQFYDNGRMGMITGKDGEPHEVDMSANHLMGERKRGAVPPPPYTVRIQVQRLNPAAIQAQNELIMNAYTMSAQAGNPFPLSVLFSMLTVDGKDKLMPILQGLDMQAQQMQQLAEQNQQLAQTVQEQQASIDGMRNLVRQSMVAASNSSQAGRIAMENQE